MRALVVLTAIVGALALPTVASGGGWATVGFTPLPDGTSAGGTWSPTILVKQHGVTPLSGLQPVVMIENEGTGVSTEVAARETAEAGVYEADVVFPSAGAWRVTVNSGFGDSNVTYGPVTIAPTGGTGDGQPLRYIVPAVVAIGILGALLVFGAWRSRRLSPASG
jgi:hypothetical protein